MAYESIALLSYTHTLMLPESAKRLLYPYFSDLDLDLVRLREGVPWYVPMKVAAYTDNECIYFASGAYDPYSAQGLALIGHEMAHIAQYKKFGKWRFRALYLSSWFAGLLRHRSFVDAYFRNRFEIEARMIEDRIYADLACKLEHDIQRSM